MIESLLYSMQNIITLSPAEIAIVKSLFKEKTYKKGDFFWRKGGFAKMLDLLPRV